MGKKKIADSIIIRVGGGIREVPREPVEIAENLEASHGEPGFERPEDVHSIGADLGTSIKIALDKIVH